MQVLRALMVPTWGEARVVALPAGPELEQRKIQELIGCRYVQVVQLAMDLTMWLDEEATSQPAPPEANRAATRIGVAHGYPRRCVGTVVNPAASRRAGEDVRASFPQVLDHSGLRTTRPEASSNQKGQARRRSRTN